MSKRFFRNAAVHLLIISAVGFFAYSNTFNSTFHFDDKVYIVDNRIIRDINYFRLPLDLTKIETANFMVSNTFMSRFFAYLTLALNYKLHGLDVTGYHIANLLIHIFNAIFVYWLVVLSFKTDFLGRSSIKSSSDIIALVSGVLFVCHPLQTQAVTYLTQRFASLAVTFYLVSLIIYVKARLSDLRVKRYIFYAASFVSAVMAMKTKEIAFTLPAAVALYEFFFFKGKTARRLLYLVPFMLTMVIIPLDQIETAKTLRDIDDIAIVSKECTEISRQDYLLTQFRVIVTYMRLLLLPINQNLDYDYPLFRSFSEPDVFLSFLFLSSIFFSGIYLFYRSSSLKTHGSAHLRFVSFGIFWFFITSSIESGIIPIYDIIFEHRMYLPATGAFVAIAAAIFAVLENQKDKSPQLAKLAVIFLGLLMLLFTTATYVRNSVWQNDIFLWQDVIKKSPKKVRGYINLSHAMSPADWTRLPNIQDSKNIFPTGK